MTGARFGMNMISAVTPKGAMRFAVFDGTTTAASFIAFCKRLLHDAPGPVYLMVDGHPARRAKAVKDFAASTDGRLNRFSPARLLTRVSLAKRMPVRWPLAPGRRSGGGTGAAGGRLGLRCRARPGERALRAGRGKVNGHERDPADRQCAGGWAELVGSLYSCSSPRERCRSVPPPCAGLSSCNL